MTVGVSNQLIVPITLWGNEPPTHCISAIFVTPDQKTIVTGCNDGHICLWSVEKKDGKWDPSSITPRYMLFGHSAPVMCLTNASSTFESSILVSSSEAGEMSTWDINDGRCIETTRLQYIHTNIQSYLVSGHEESRLFCNGYYSEILVISSQSLEILFTLTSRSSPDWISAMHVVRPPKRQDDVVIGLSVAGVVKVWTLSGNESRCSEPMYENEFKPLRCSNPLKLVCCSYNLRTVLVISSKNWQIYDAGDFSLLCSIHANPGEKWTGGDFLTAERVVVWSDLGKGYLYKLPTNLLKGKVISCIPDNKDFHSKAHDANQPCLYYILQTSGTERLLCPPVATYSMCARGLSSSLSDVNKVFVRGDSLGQISVWNIPEVAGERLTRILQEKSAPILVHNPDAVHSLRSAWETMVPTPCGIFDQLIQTDHHVRITASVYMPLQGRLVCGRDDGSIIIISATRTVMMQLLATRKRHSCDWTQHQILEGHSGRVTCLLYPHHIHSRYDISFLLSGGVDFSVCLWDIYSGTLLHRFSVQAGEITQLLIPPKDCTPRILSSICSVASDHSVALLSLKERKCIMLASRHLFPINVIKWRPLDDFMVVGCCDGSVYVWQMETGHLDRVVQGIIAEEILGACDEHSASPSGDKLRNPAIHLFRGLKSRNLAAIKQAAARGLHHLGVNQQQESRDVVDLSIQSRSHPLMIQGLKANPKDQDSHVLFFDVESMIVDLLSEEYSLLSPGSLESQGLTTNAEFQKFLFMSCSPESQNKLSGLFSKVKENAGSAAAKIQARAEKIQVRGEKIQLKGEKIQLKGEKVGFKPGSAELSLGTRSSASSEGSGSGPGTPVVNRKAKVQLGETNLTMEIAQIILSLLHAWGLDVNLDRICETKLGLLRPLHPVCFGLLSKAGHMSLLLPMAIARLDQQKPPSTQPLSTQPLSTQPLSTQPSSIPNQGVNPFAPSVKQVRMVEGGESEAKNREGARTANFVARIHWELSTAMTTTHLLSIISLSNALMSMSSATFVMEQERKRKMMRRLSRGESRGEIELNEGFKGLETQALAQEQQQVRQGWSSLAALHCINLTDLVKSQSFKKPLLEVLARRWQDRCIEIREAAQALLLAELQRLGSRGRKQLVDEWSHFLPQFDPLLSSHQGVGHSNAPSSVHSVASSNAPSPSPSEANMREHLKENEDIPHGSDDEDEEERNEMDRDGSNPSRRTSATTVEGRRKQTTAIILLGVIGAEYGNEIEASKKRNLEGMEMEGKRKNLEGMEMEGKRKNLEGMEMEGKRKNLEGMEMEGKRKSVVEGFGGLGNYSLARHTSHALAYLLLAKPSRALPPHTSLRRAAIDLIGRGFPVWEPYLDISKVLLGLLELCCEVDRLVPTLSFGLPLTPAADSCRTAKHAIALIAQARPGAFITTLAREVVKYNSMQQNPNSISVNLYNVVLAKAKPEILRNVELLIEKMPNEVSGLMIETMDISLHCIDTNHLKTKTLAEVFPAITKFSNVTFCPASKRIAVGAKNGQLAIYELRTPQKQQMIVAHSQAITCCSFSPDGKHLASYSMDENKMCFWSTATTLFGLGNAQTKCIRTFNTPPHTGNIISLQAPTGPKSSLPRLIWVANKVLILMFSDGSEHRYSL